MNLKISLIGTRMTQIKRTYMDNRILAYPRDLSPIS